MLQFPFPRVVGRSGTGSGKWSPAGEAVAVWRAHEIAGRGESGETLVERGVADATGDAQFGKRDGAAGGGEGSRDALIHRGRRGLGRRAALDHLQRERVTA